MSGLSIDTEIFIGQFNQSFHYTVNVTDENLAWVNFTITDPDGINVVDNVNGTNSGTLWNSSTFILNKSSDYNYTIIAYDSDGLSDTETGLINFILISESLTPSTVSASQTTLVSGMVNWSNGTTSPNAEVHVYTNGTEQFFNDTGDGSDGTLTVSSADTIVNNYTYLMGNESAGNLTIVVNDSTNFTSGDEILIIQMQNSSAGVVGTYEFTDVSSVSEDEEYDLTKLKRFKIILLRVEFQGFTPTNSVPSALTYATLKVK